MRKLIRSQKNYLNLKNWLSQDKNCQKIGIHLILALQKPDQNF